MKSKLLISLILVSIGAFLYGLNREEPARAVFFAVGQGDSALLQVKGVNVLVDAGPARDGYDAGKVLLLPKLRELGIEDISLIFLSHPDSDHIGGAGAVLERYPEARLVANRAFATHPDMVDALQRWQVPSEKVHWVRGQSIWRIGDATIRAYAPPPADEDNAASLVLQFNVEGAKAVLSGDSPIESEIRAAKVADWSSDLMTAGHHGSRTSSSYPWLREVKPRQVVISCGRDNPYGHPATETLHRLTLAKATVHRTDLEGDLVFEVRDGRFVRIN